MQHMLIAPGTHAQLRVEGNSRFKNTKPRSPLGDGDLGFEIERKRIGLCLPAQGSSEADFCRNRSSGLGFTEVSASVS
jgi:hypothetical protein